MTTQRFRHPRVLIAATICFLAVLAGCSSSSVNSAGKHGPASTAMSTPQFLACIRQNAAPPNNPPSIRPTSIYYECGAIHPYNWFDGLRWSSWDSTSATAVGTFNQNTCNPSCATPRLLNYPVGLVLSKPASVAGLNLFTLLKIHFTRTPATPTAVPTGLTEQGPTEFTRRLPGVCPNPPEAEVGCS